MNNEILVMAGIAAAQKWDIDLTKVNVKFVDSLEPFLVSNPQHFDMANPPSLTRSRTPVDNMIFESYDKGTHWGCGDARFWLAWGPVTNTLAIAILQFKDRKDIENMKKSAKWIDAERLRGRI